MLATRKNLFQMANIPSWQVLQEFSMMYNKNMPVNSHTETTPNDDGSTTDKLVVEFTNGSLQQLKDLANFFDISDKDPYKVLELGIAFLQRVREQIPKEDLKPKRANNHGPKKTN